MDQGDLSIPSRALAPGMGISVTMLYYLGVVLAGENEHKQGDLVSAFQAQKEKETWRSYKEKGF